MLPKDAPSHVRFKPEDAAIELQLLLQRALDVFGAAESVLFAFEGDVGGAPLASKAATMASA